MDWFRMYDEILNDPKIRRIKSAAKFGIICTMMCLANKGRPRGSITIDEGLPFELEEIAEKAMAPPDLVQEVIDYLMSDKIRILVRDEGILRFANWEKRQYGSDNSTDRWRKWKQRQNTNVGQTLVTETANVGQTLPDTDTDTDTDINKNISAPAGAGVFNVTPAEKPEKGGAQALKPGKGNEYTPEFESFWLEYPRKKEKVVAFKVWKTRLKDGHAPDEIIRAATNYAAECRQKGTSADYIKHAATFLGPNKPFLEYQKGGQDDGRASTTDLLAYKKNSYFRKATGMQ